MGWFDRKSDRPELVSLHIPKTAGTSFRNMLKSVYGEDAVVRFDINERAECRLNEVLLEQDVIPKHVRVLHGHFVMQDLFDRFTIPKEAKFITWLRDPVDRVVSNFYYLEKRLAELLDEERRNLNIRSKMQRNLIEYARADLNRNRQSKFLMGKELEHFDFVGIQAFMNEDLAQVGSILGWNEMPELLHHNPTGETKPKDIPTEWLDEIRELNSLDQALYERGLAMRQSRIQK